MTHDLKALADRLEDGDYANISGVIAALLWAAQEIERKDRLYNELLYAVASKFPDESRHQTALRYIKSAEHRPHGVGQCAELAKDSHE